MAVAEVHNWSWREVSGAGVEFQVESRFSSPGTGGVSGGIQIFLPRKRRSFRWNPDFPPLSGVGSLRWSWRDFFGAGVGSGEVFLSRWIPGEGVGPVSGESSPLLTCIMSGRSFWRVLVARNM